MELKRVKEIIYLFRHERVYWHGMEIDVTLEYEPWFLGRNWKVGITIFKPPIAPAYSKVWRFWRYKSALRKFNEVVESLKNPKVVEVVK